MRNKNKLRRSEAYEARKRLFILQIFPLGERKIERHYNEVDLLEDVQTIQEGF
jgi:hypothetical protein